MSETVGEVFNRQGPCVLMSLVLRLAEAHKRIPVGRWLLELGDGFTLKMNGTKEAWGHVEPFGGMVMKHGWPIAMFNTVEGIQVGADGEDQAIAALQRALKSGAHS